VIQYYWQNRGAGARALKFWLNRNTPAQQFVFNSGRLADPFWTRQLSSGVSTGHLYSCFRQETLVHQSTETNPYLCPSRPSLLLFLEQSLNLTTTFFDHFLYHSSSNQAKSVNSYPRFRVIKAEQVPQAIRLDSSHTECITVLHNMVDEMPSEKELGEEDIAVDGSNGPAPSPQGHRYVEPSWQRYGVSSLQQPWAVHSYDELHQIPASPSEL